MKAITAILTIVLMSVNNLTSTNNDKKHKITATVVNVTSNEGKVGFALYDKENFMKKPLLSKNAKIINGKSTITFEGIETGEYAILCFHDKNDNGTMDFEDNGMPMEDYGASNNVMNFGPPRFEDAKFMVSDKDVSLEIKF